MKTYPVYYRSNNFDHVKSLAPESWIIKAKQGFMRFAGIGQAVKFKLFGKL